jgi:L-ascorbate metabolism protein UlaG (beta-lactamase superfamily)
MSTASIARDRRGFLKTIVATATLLFSRSSAASAASLANNHYYKGPITDHFDGLRFFNANDVNTDRSLTDILRWRLKERAAGWPRSISVQQAVPAVEVTGLRATVIGHASVLIQAGGLNVLTDPVWSERASPVALAGPRRVSAPGIAFDDLPPIHAILLSHNHYDHMDIPTLRRLSERHRPLIVTPIGNDTIVRRAIPGARVVTGDWWDMIDVGNGGKVTIVPAYHWSTRSLLDRRMALWSGFMMQTTGGSTYFAGDTGYGDGQIFREIRTRLGRPDLALIPIGGYAPRWFMREQHADPDEAVRIMEILGAVRAVGIHWGTFQLTNEAWGEPPTLLASALRQRGIAPHSFPAGEPGRQYEPSSKTAGTLPGK